MLRPIADKLKTDIIDYTEGEPHIIWRWIFLLVTSKDLLLIWKYLQ
jgi:hypothetical protein